MRLLVLSILSLVAACSVNTEKPLSSAQEQSSSQAQSIVTLAKDLTRLQEKLQPNSWDVSIDEAMSKENPFAPPEFVLNSGQAPKGYQGDVGLWNCQKLEVGSFQCDYEASNYMIAQVFENQKTGYGKGQVAVFGSRSHILLATCNESGAVQFEVIWRLVNNFIDENVKLTIAFENEPKQSYAFTLLNESSLVVLNNKKIFEKLNSDFEYATVSVQPSNGATNDGIRFIVKNFPKAWFTACGWHTSYDAINGVKHANKNTF